MIVVGDLDALAACVQAATHAALAEQLGISRSHLTHLYRGTKAVVPGSLLVLLEERLRACGLRPARQTPNAQP